MHTDPNGDHTDCDHAQESKVCTAACSRFFKENSAGVIFIGWVLNLALRADETARTAAQALYDIDGDPKHLEHLKKIEMAGATSTMRSHLRRFLEMSLCRAVDNYLAYVSELLFSIFRTRPETLRSSETVRLDVVLKHGTMEELISELSDRRVTELSYRGLKDLSEYLDDKLGLPLFSNADDLGRGIRIVEARNLLVHARGLVNSIFLKKSGREDLKIGDLHPIDGNVILDDMDFLAHSVLWLDKAAIGKFRLRTLAKDEGESTTSPPAG